MAKAAAIVEELVGMSNAVSCACHSPATADEPWKAERRGEEPAIAVL